MVVVVEEEGEMIMTANKQIDGEEHTRGKAGTLTHVYTHQPVLCANKQLPFPVLWLLAQCVCVCVYD